LNNFFELGTTYLQAFFFWMLCSELVLSFACVYFVVSAHFMPFWSFSILRANLASIEKSAAGKVAEVGPDPDYRRRLRQDSAFLFWTRIRTRSLKF